MTRYLRRLADNRNAGSIANRLRHRRFQLFESLLQGVQPPYRILDVGGTPSFWEMRGYAGRPDVSIVVLNLKPLESQVPNISTVVGDATDMAQIADGEFAMVFSNSVIEHVGTFPRQMQMGSEIRRVGKRYFVQTPNRSFPLEPHFLVPWFQFLPESVRVAMLRRFTLGWHARTPDAEAARAAVRAIRLMSGRELQQVFPGGRLYRERVLGMTKSFIVHGGWDD